MAKSDVVLGFCSHRAAVWAVQHWYYRPEMPAGKLVKVGVWEKGRFSGVVIFGTGASTRLGSPFGLPNHEACELARLALRPGHDVQVSRVLRIAVKLLHERCPGVRVVVSFADPRYHRGAIYQAAGWTYTGQGQSDKQYIDRFGRQHHSRSVKESGVVKAFNGRMRKVPRPSECTVVEIPGKHRYVLGLDDELRARVAEMAKDPPTAIASAEPAREA